MDLQMIFDQFTAGELRNVYVGDTTESILSEQQKEELIIHINMGLTELHKRFPLKENMTIINLSPDTFRYQLQESDVLRIESVRDLWDNEYLLNVEGDEDSMFTPSYRVLDVPKNLQTEKNVHALEVFYRANHPMIDKRNRFENPATVEVDLPHTHLEPLLYYVASRVLNPIGMSDQFHDGNNYAAKYEQSVQQLLNDGHMIQKGFTNSNFRNSGWV